MDWELISVIEIRIKESMFALSRTINEVGLSDKLLTMKLPHEFIICQYIYSLLINSDLVKRRKCVHLNCWHLYCWYSTLMIISVPRNGGEPKTNRCLIVTKRYCDFGGELVGSWERRWSFTQLPSLWSRFLSNFLLRFKQILENSWGLRFGYTLADLCELFMFRKHKDEQMDTVFQKIWVDR